MHFFLYLCRRNTIKIYHNMSKYRILIVDDEDDICMILSYSLQQAGYDTQVCHSAEDALQVLQTTDHIDLILLDIMMDGMSGLEMAEKLRSDIGNRTSGIGTPPIIFLTALADETTVLQGFKLGADDYITKPFRIAEVLARVKAVLRRTEESSTTNTPTLAEDDNCIIYEGVVVNKTTMSLTVDGTPVDITRKEIDLLCYLLTHRGQVLSREHLLNQVWDKNGYVLERTVDVHITHLRRKLGAYSKHIVTKSGYGYLFDN